ncbi:MAG TPA: lysophospholipid acyltransferase family protein [Planctomycetota bacterium]|nr:lysophospholipid acyltransferase family protein [Planctomycetota bacterium]
MVGFLGPLVLRAWVGTLRVRLIGCDPRKAPIPYGPECGIYTFWHQRMLVPAALYRNSDMLVLISSHGDGEMIARVIKRQGMLTVRGSTTRGGTRAILEILKKLRDLRGEMNVGITPDGPRGPRHHFHHGAIYMASRSGLPIYPLVVASKRQTKLRTWDGFVIPWPFTRTILRLGEGFRVPASLDGESLERIRADAERRLRDLTEVTERDFDRLYPLGIRLRDFGKPVEPGV